MRLLKKKTYLAFIVLVFLAGCECLPRPLPRSEITIASFNIEAFGQTKASKPEVMEILANIIRKYDIVAIQEIRDAAGTAILALRD